MNRAEIEKEIANHERRYWQAMKDRDADAAIALTDEACIVAGAQGVATLAKSAIGQMLKSPSWSLDAFEISDVQVTLPTDDVAVIAYRVKERVSVEGKPLSIEAADASTWIRRDGKWLCALHSESLAGDPFGRNS